MAKRHGSTARIYAGGYDLSGSATDLEVNPTVEVADSTTFSTGGAQTTAKSYLVGIADGKATVKGFFDDTPGAIYPMIAALRGAAAVPASFYPAGDGSQGNPGYGAEAELLDSVKLASPVKGVTTLDCSWQATGGFEDLVALLSRTVVAGSGSGVTGTVVDNGASSALGASAYFNILALDVACTVSAFKVQHSADNSTWADLLTTGLAGTAVGADRQATSGSTTINRYIRVSYTVTNAKNATLQVGFSRH